MKILQQSNCPSLSGISTLRYDISCNDNKEIYISLSGNSGKGVFSKDLVAYEDIKKLLTDFKGPISSGTLKSLYEGKSSNSVGFMLAILIDMGVVQFSKDGIRTFDAKKSKEFISETKKTDKSLSSTKPKKPAPKKPKKQ